MDLLIKTGYKYEENYEANTLFRMDNIFTFLTAVLTLDDQHEKIQEFIDKYSFHLIKYEDLLSFYIRTIPQDENDDGYNIQILMDIFGHINSAFTSSCKSRSIIANKLHNNEVPPSSYVKTYNINIYSHHIHYNCYKQLLQQSTRKMSVDEIMSLKIHPLKKNASLMDFTQISLVMSILDSKEEL